ncbi:ABC transporter permease [Bacilli bacterium]|uniref:ABC transporter permease n=1 Tax=Oceanobacillus sp. FSL K6-0118 TaxID=2921418 RepID=UPI00069B1B1B|nr:ABC transporter permease [Bacilli bacterium]PZD90698.1 ABC transporter permease [Bacilli bacterium]PZD91823.1 ABC transporter permease [Bacilli bacterium]RCO06555.1 ABC transporter permease [Bacilli bacterium]RCO10547.1 ABC transporter permease [Bacilli bacterium]
MKLRILTVAKREIKLGFRNSWTYSFMILLSIFTVAILLLQSGVATTQGYTDMTGTVINMTLYLLPLITLLLGGFSVAVEKEDGQWGLLSTYPISVYTFLWGKWIGLAVILLTMLFFSFGLAGVITIVFGQELSINTLVFFWLFSTVLALVYLSIALFIGSIAMNRWQSLIGGIAVWFLTIIIWPLLMISTLSHLPSYKLVKPTLQVLTLLNPAEFIRVVSIMRFGAGAAFGADYYKWITWATSSYGILIFFGVFLSWIFVSIFVGGFIWNRGDKNEAD